MDKTGKRLFFSVLAASILVSGITGASVGFWAGSLADSDSELSRWVEKNVFGENREAESQEPAEEERQVIRIDEESAVVSSVEKVSPAVVSIIVSKDLPVIERYYNDGGSDLFREFFGDGWGDFFNFRQPQYRQNGTEKREIGGGSGFLVSSDGYIISNKHVVEDEEADYTVLMNDESKHEAKVLARDPINDLAILKIEGKDLAYIDLGDSGNLKVGQSVIAIGNALAEFRNTVSTGVISGLARSIVAGGTGFGSEQLSNVIQTDASINPGNSGGPLLNLAGQAIGINTAIVQGAQNIGFAIPINEVKNVYDSVRKFGKIVRPWLGVRYVQVNGEIKEKNQLPVDYGALIVRGEDRTDLAVIPGSPADKAGLEENDIILEIKGQKITSENPLNKMIANFKAGDEIDVKILHDGKEETVKVKLEEMKP